MELNSIIKTAAILSRMSLSTFLSGVVLEGTIGTISEPQRGGNKNGNITDEEQSNNQLQVTELQARVAQELAIARRIELAEEVEIEEYFEGNGEGGVGFQSTVDSLRIGAHGSGNRIVKRVYRFKGFQVTSEDQLLGDASLDSTEGVAAVEQEHPEKVEAATPNAT